VFADEYEIIIPFDAFLKFADCSGTRRHPLKSLCPNARINANTLLIHSVYVLCRFRIDSQLLLY